MTTTEAVCVAIGVRDTLWLIVQTAEQPSSRIVALLRKLNDALEALVCESLGFTAPQVAAEQQRIRLCANLARGIAADVMENEPALLGPLAPAVNAATRFVEQHLPLLGGSCEHPSAPHLPEAPAPNAHPIE